MATPVIPLTSAAPAAALDQLGFFLVKINHLELGFR
jgi:hypothetical protein